MASLGPLDLCIGFLSKQCFDAIQQNVELAILEIANAPGDLLQEAYQQTITGNVFDDIASSPLGQMGQDFLATEVNKAANVVANNVAGITQDLTNFENATQTVFNSILAMMASRNDLLLYMMQVVAKNAINAIIAKRTALLTLQGRLTALYNALVLINGGFPQYSAYLTQLRQALIAINQATIDLTIVESTFATFNNFQSARFSNVQSEIATAVGLLTPPSNNPEIQFNTQTILPNLGQNLLQTQGVPNSQTLTAMLSVPALASSCLIAADTYIVSVTTVNNLLDAFKSGLNTLQTTTGGKIKDMTVSTLNAAITGLTSVRAEMATVLNGAPTAVLKPLPRFQTTPTKVAGYAVSWVVQLKVIQNVLNTLPAQGFKNLNFSNQLLAAYELAVKQIESLGNLSEGGAVLQAVQGDEQVGDLESQLITFLSASQQAILSGSVSQPVLALGRTVLARLNLSIEQDQMIQNDLQAFVNTPVPNDIAALGNAISSLLKAFGLDRAADLLNNGNFADFMAMDSKTATYAGAALVGIQALKKCLNFSPDFDFELQLRNLMFSFFLRFKRVAGRSIKLQIQNNLVSLASCTGLIAKLRGLGSICNLTDQSAPSRLRKELGPSLGVSDAQTGQDQSAAGPPPLAPAAQTINSSATGFPPVGLFTVLFTSPSIDQRNQDLGTILSAVSNGNPGNTNSPSDLDAAQQAGINAVNSIGVARAQVTQVLRQMGT